jgi:hypothetical protein
MFTAPKQRLLVHRNLHNHRKCPSLNIIADNQHEWKWSDSKQPVDVAGPKFVFFVPHQYQEGITEEGCMFAESMVTNTAPKTVMQCCSFENIDAMPFTPKRLTHCPSLQTCWHNTIPSEKAHTMPFLRTLQTCWHNTIPSKKAHTMPFLRKKVMQHGSCSKGLRNSVLSEKADEVPFLLKKLTQCRSFGKGSRCAIPLVIALQCCSFGKGSHNTIPLDKSHTIPFLCKHHCW